MIIWLIRNFVCRLVGHAEGVRVPLFKAWYSLEEHRSVCCPRCSLVIGEYTHNKPNPFAGTRMRVPSMYGKK